MAEQITKYNRIYSLRIEFFENDTGINLPGYFKPTGASATYTLPLTIEFDIEHNSFASVNNCNIKIYNLNALDIAIIRKNQLDWSHGMNITLNAGYRYGAQAYEATVFTGVASEAWTEREGSDMVTYIQCFDGGFVYGQATYSGTFGAGTSKNSIIDTLMKSLGPYGVKYGKRGNFPGSLGKDTTYSGFTTKLLHQETAGGFFIANGNSYCLNANEALPNSVVTLSPETGLLNTPHYQQTYLDIDFLFEPKIQMGQLVNLKSVTAQNYDGQYIVKSISHQVTISNVISGDAITHLGLQTGSFKQLE